MEFHPRKIGIMGASAGGFALPLPPITSASRPDFQILLYPVVTMIKVLMAVREMLLGGNPTRTKVLFELQVPDITSIYRSYLR
ncbi:MAG: hypothetical protein ACLT63_07445 [Bacteroides xylanisolvens]